MQTIVEPRKLVILEILKFEKEEKHLKCFSKIKISIVE